jgi:hypothetical protein
MMMVRVFVHGVLHKDSHECPNSSKFYLCAHEFNTLE